MVSLRLIDNVLISDNDSYGMTRGVFEEYKTRSISDCWNSQKCVFDEVGVELKRELRC